MKFSVKGDKLAEYLSKLNSVIPSRSPLPILDNILFDLKGNELKLLASDLEIFIRTTLEVEGKKDGRVAIPARRLLDISRTLTSASLSVEVNDKNRITIKTSNGKYTIGGEPAEDFPSPEEKSDLHTINLDGHTFKRYLSKTIHAVNTDELRRNMSGVLMDVNRNELKFVATDGFRLAKIIKKDFKKQSEIEEKIIIPLKTGQHIMKLNNNDDSKIEFDDIDLKVSFSDVEIYSKLIDDSFPSYENVIPKDNDKILKVSKILLSDSLKRALIFADVITKRVRLEIKSGSMEIKADNPEIVSEGEETIECTFVSNSGSEDFDKSPFVIAFNASYLLDAVSQMETEEINISFGNSSKAAITTPSKQADNEDFIELIMPVRVG